MKKLFLMLLIISSVFAESCKQYQSELDLYLLCYEDVLYFFNKSRVLGGFGGRYVKSSNSLVVGKDGKPRTCKCLPNDQMHIDIE